MAHKTYEIEKAIAEQLAVEQGLRATRMNWNLTFQGFMVAAFALVASEDLTPARFLLEIIICVAGFFVALATYLGVKAAQIQSGKLKRHWQSVVASDSPYPKPFSDDFGSRLGRMPTVIICGTTMLMWIALAGIVIWAPSTF